MSKITTALTISAILAQLVTADIYAERVRHTVRSKDSKTEDTEEGKRGPRGKRGHRGERGHRGKRGHRGSTGSEGVVGPSAFPASPIGAGYYFAEIQAATSTGARNFTTDIGWNLISTAVAPLVSWNVFYSGDSFSHNGLSRLTYTGTTPITVVVRAVLGARVNIGNFGVSNTALGIGVNGFSPPVEQEINVTTVATGAASTGGTTDFTSEILLTLNPGDYIEPYIFSQLSLSIGAFSVSYLRVTVSEWNGLH